MDAADYFVLPDGRLRAGWRFLLFLFIFVAAAALCNGLISLFIGANAIATQTVLVATSSLIFLASVCAPTWLMMSLLEHQSFWDVGLRLNQRAAREMGIGLAGGAVLVAAVAVVEWSVGGVYFQPSASGTVSTVAVVAASSGIFVLAASAEELLFRGYPFQRLVEGTNVYVALAISCFIFGWLHKPNPNSTYLSVANTILAGVLLSLAYLKTHALWLPLGFHFSWNWTQAMTGFPVSGVELVRLPWQAMPVSTHLWLHGGEYGPEGGVVATGALALGIIFLIRFRSTPSTSAPAAEHQIPDQPSLT